MGIAQCSATKTAINDIAAWAGFVVVGTDHAQGQLHSTRLIQCKARATSLNGFGTSIIFVVVFRSHASNLKREAC